MNLTSSFFLWIPFFLCSLGACHCEPAGFSGSPPRCKGMSTPKALSRKAGIWKRTCNASFASYSVQAIFSRIIRKVIPKHKKNLKACQKNKQWWWSLLYSGILTLKKHPSVWNYERLILCEASFIPMTRPMKDWAVYALCAPYQEVRTKNLRAPKKIGGEFLNQMHTEKPQKM